MIYRFAGCEFDTEQHSLRRAGQSQRLPPKVFQVLVYLITHCERVISKQELCEQVWEGRAISDAAMESCLRTVRRSIGDEGRTKRVIQTQRGYGYQFVAPVERESVLPAHEVRDAAPPHEPWQASPGLAPEPAPSSLGLRSCQACQQANTLEATFCRACGVRLPQRCPRCGHEGVLSDLFCATCGQSFAGAVPVRAEEPVPGAPEHRPVTVLCCALRTTAMDADAYHAVLLEVHAQMQDLVQTYEGYLHPVVGEHFLLLFGIPTAHEDDAWRALHVAWALRQRLSTLCQRLGLLMEVPLAVRLGLHTGMAVVGSLRVPTDAATTLTLVGEVVALATALQEQAAPGMIVCSAATARLLENVVQLAPAGTLPGTATTDGMAIYSVQHVLPKLPPVTARLHRIFSPFVGREREMALLQAALSQVETGRGQVVGIVGEAGLGKSRLLHEFRQGLAQTTYTYVTGQCLSYATTTPYWTVSELVQHACGLQETDGDVVLQAKVHERLHDWGLDTAECGPVLRHLLGKHDAGSPLAALTPEARKLRTLSAFTNLWLHGAAQRPLILEVENVHWLDASSAECLHALIERIAGAPLLLLLTYRPGYQPAWTGSSYSTQIPLQPLTAPESLEVVQATLPGAVPHMPLVHQLVARAGGNPFFLEELARSAVEQGATTSQRVPDTVHAVLQARMDRLSPPLKRLLQAAAVLGKEGTLPVLQAVAEVSDAVLTAGVQHLQGAEFLYEIYAPPVRRYTFKHALTQEVAYQALVRHVRQQWHTRIVHVLEMQGHDVRETQPEALAHHCTEAGLTLPAIGYWQRAGARAVERSANIEAVSHFTRGLQLVATLPQTPEHLQQELALQLALGPPLLIVHGHTSPDVRQTYTRAYALAHQLDDPVQRFAVLAGLWRFHLSAAQLGTASELAEQCATLAHTMPAITARHEAHLMVGSTAFFQGDFVTARMELEHGIALQDAQQGQGLAWQRGTAPGVVCLARLAWTLWRLGYPDQARRRSHEALQLAQELGHTYSLIFAQIYEAHLQGWCGAASTVRTQMEQLLPAMRTQGFVQFVGGGQMRYGWALVAQGEQLAGMTQLREGLHTQETYGVLLGHQDLWAMLAWACGQAGQLPEGFEAIKRALELAQEHNEQYCLPELYRLHGELYRQDGCSQEAEACLQQSLALAQHQHAKAFELRSALSLSRLWRDQGRVDVAHQCLAEVYAWFTEGFDTQDLQEAHALLATFPSRLG